MSFYFGRLLFSKVEKKEYQNPIWPLEKPSSQSGWFSQKTALMGCSASKINRLFQRPSVFCFITSGHMSILSSIINIHSVFSPAINFNSNKVLNMAFYDITTSNCYQSILKSVYWCPKNKSGILTHVCSSDSQANHSESQVNFSTRKKFKCN